MKIVSINQPAYLPWLGYFQRIAASDVHIVLDHVQFEKNSMVNRNKIRTANGWCWLSIPLKTSGKFGCLPINQLEMVDDKWQKKHWDSLVCNYAKARYWKQYAAEIEPFFRQNHTGFMDMIKPLLQWQLSAFQIDRPLLFSSDLAPECTKSDLVLELCRKVNADVYLSGPFGRDYLQLEDFARHNIQVFFQDYVHPEYEQRYPGFEAYMAAVDLLFNHGSESYRIMNENQRMSPSKDVRTGIFRAVGKKREK